MSIYDFNVKDIKGNSVSMSDFRNKVLLIVNTASMCGFTPQYKGLQEMYAQLRDEGLEILGFPCNQFGFQEPKSNDQIIQHCELNFGVTFPLFAKIEVNGDKADPLYKFLKKAAPGLFGTEAIKWNFTKFLVDRDGKVVKRYAPGDTPENLLQDVKKLLTLTDHIAKS